MNSIFGYRSHRRKEFGRTLNHLIKHFEYSIEHPAEAVAGNGEAYINRKIKNIEDIKEIEKIISKQKNVSGVFVQNFQLLRKERVHND